MTEMDAFPFTLPIDVWATRIPLSFSLVSAFFPPPPLNGFDTLKVFSSRIFRAFLTPP